MSIIINLLFFIFFLFVLLKSAGYATHYSSNLAKIFRLSEFVVSFFIVAVISALPEGTISIVSAIKGVPEFGLGTLLGSNIADLALVFGIIALISNKKVVVKSEVLKKNFYYLILLLFPIIMGFDGYLSRTEGVLLIIAGLSFFLSLCIESRIFRKKYNHIKDRSLFKNISLLILSIVVLTLSANYAIKFGVDFAHGIKISPMLVGLTMVSIGSCLPELFFSIKAVKTNHNSLALGDVLGTVITDATIIVGIIAVISPFYFNPLIIYVTGVAMFIAGALTIAFITTGKALNKLEGLYLIFFYICYIMTELLVNNLNK